MSHHDAALMEPSGPFLGTASRGEHYGHFLLGDNFHHFRGLWTHQRHVHAEVVVCRLTAFNDMISQHLWCH